MRFTTSTITAARRRQCGRCAYCGMRLNDLVEHAHHLVPRSCGGGGGIENCVIVCEDCHHRVHADGRYRSGFVASPGEFRYIHGRLASGSPPRARR